MADVLYCFRVCLWQLSYNRLYLHIKLKLQSHGSYDTGVFLSVHQLITIINAVSSHITTNVCTLIKATC